MKKWTIQKNSNVQISAVPEILLYVFKKLECSKIISDMFLFIYDAWNKTLQLLLVFLQELQNPIIDFDNYCKNPVRLKYF